VEIKRFMNIRHRQWVRVERQHVRQDLEEMWGDTPECRLDNEENGSWKYHEIFDLRRLFGEEPYIEIIEEEEWYPENWNEEEEEEWEDLVAPGG